MIRQQYSLRVEPVVRNIFLKLRVVVKETRRFYHYRFSVLFYDKYFVVYEVVRLIRVQLYRSEIVYVHLALA